MSYLLVFALIEGHAIFGDEMYRWSTACRQANVDEEVADALVYLTSGPLRLISGQP